jgi:hypothetical protein
MLRGQVAERARGVCYFDARDAVRIRATRMHQQRRRTASDCVGDEARAVVLLAAQRHEQRSRSTGTRIDGHTFDRQRLARNTRFGHQAPARRRSDLRQLEADTIARDRRGHQPAPEPASSRAASTRSSKAWRVVPTI